MTTPSVAPPSPQEIHRKLSVHSVARSAQPSIGSIDAPISSTESDSDSIVVPSLMPPSVHGLSNSLHTSSMPPLSSIAERRSGSGEDTEEEDEEEDGWKSADIRRQRQNLEEGVIKSGYLWKKGERRKTWKKRWFVLRPAHLAYYKSSAEYQLLRLLELSDVHSCTQVTLKRHQNTFGLVSPVRTFYLQAQTPGEVQEWVQAIEDARLALTGTLTQNSASTPIAIPTPTRRSASNLVLPNTPSSRTNSARACNVTSSDSEDASPSRQRGISVSPQDRQHPPLSPFKPQATISKEPSSKIVLSGYLMKCGSKRRNWRKRWFVLSEEKLLYSGSHMDTKPHRQFSLSQILDALEYDLPPNRNSTSLSSSMASASPLSEADGPQGAHTFKIVTTKRTLLLCAPSEEDEIKWLGSIRALIARRSGVPGEHPSQGISSSRSVEHHPSMKTKGVFGVGVIPEEGAQGRP